MPLAATIGTMPLAATISTMPLAATIGTMPLAAILNSALPTTVPYGLKMIGWLTSFKLYLFLFLFDY